MIGDPQKKPPSASIGYFALIPLILGIVLVAISLSDITALRRLDLSGSSATGTVVDLLKIEMRRGSAYCPLVRFTTTSGTVVQFKDSACGGPRDHHVGEEVHVLYIAEAPAESAAVDRGQSGWFISAFMGLIGALSIWLSIRFTLGLRRARRDFELKRIAQVAAADPSALR
jgi:uncharacterized protein DUF3592